MATNAYTLFPPLDESGDTPSKFGPDAVNVNTNDDITKEQIDALLNVIAEFPSLWEDRIGRVIEPEEDWMEIPLKPGAVIESKGRYCVSKCGKAAIDEVLDKLREDGRMSAIEGVVPAGWPVFVVWKNGKARPVVDLRGFNEKTITDAYPLLLQDEITNCISGKYCISVIDLQKAFYQRHLRRKDRWKMTVLSHRGQEWFNVVPMGACNSPSHMQKYMDKKLMKHKDYARCYIDDIVIFSDNYADHRRHLRAVLATLSEAGMTLSPNKCYIGFHSVRLLGHVVDRFGVMPHSS
jgi:hypothetical protein